MRDFHLEYTAEIASEFTHCTEGCLGEIYIRQSIEGVLNFSITMVCSEEDNIINIIVNSKSSSQGEGIL